MSKFDFKDEGTLPMEVHVKYKKDSIRPQIGKLLKIDEMEFNTDSQEYELKLSEVGWRDI